MEMGSCKEHVTNKEVHAKIQQAIGPHEDLLTIVKTYLPFIRSGQKHLARHSARGKKTRQTQRQRKRWEDNIRDWIGLEFAKSQRAVKNRKKKKRRENWL